MSVPTAQARHLGAVADVLSSAVHAEVTRARTLPWAPMLVALAALVLMLTAAFSGVEVTVAGSGEATTSAIATTFGYSVVVLVLTVLSAILVGSDVRSGELRTSLCVVPHRGVLAAAKLVALVVLTVVTAAGLVLVHQSVLLATGNTSAGDVLGADALRTGLGFVASSTTFVLIAAALTQMLRNVLVPVAILLLSPMLLVPWLENLAPAVAEVLPYNASSWVATGAGMAGSDTGAAGGYLLLLVWAVAAATLFAVTLRFREG